MLFASWLGDALLSLLFYLLLFLWAVATLLKKADSGIKKTATKSLISYIFRKLK